MLKHKIRKHLEGGCTYGEGVVKDARTKYMVIDTARGKPEKIEESVKNGEVSEAEEYKYVGFWVNKQGNCQLLTDL